MKNLYAWVGILSFPASLYLIYLLWEKQDLVATFFACLILFLTGIEHLAKGVNELLGDKE